MSEPGEEELLAQPRSHHDATGTQRLRRDLAVGALVLVGAALIASAIAKHGGSNRGPTASASNRPLGLPAATDFVTLKPTGAAYLPESAADAVSCPQHAECTVHHHVSEPIRNAILAAFPGATITSARAVRMIVPNFGSANWSLQVQAQAADREITLHVRGLAQADDGHGYSRSLYGGHAISRYQSVLGPYYVLIQVVTRADFREPTGAMAKLARDNRLFEPW